MHACASAKVSVRLYEGQLCYSRASLLLLVTIVAPDHVGCPGFPQIIIAAERCVEEYSGGMTFPLCLVTTRHLKWHPDALHKAAILQRHLFERIKNNKHVICNLWQKVVIVIWHHGGRSKLILFLMRQKYCDKKSTKSTILVNDILIDSTEIILQALEIKKCVIHRSLLTAY